MPFRIGLSYGQGVGYHRAELEAQLRGPAGLRRLSLLAPPPLGARSEHGQAHAKRFYVPRRIAAGVVVVGVGCAVVCEGDRGL